MSNGAKVIYQRLSTGATAQITTEIAPKQQRQERDNRNPYVVYYRNQTTPNHTKNTTSVIDEQVWIVECYALTYDAAVALAEAVRSDIDRAPYGNYGSAPQASLNGSHFRNQTDPEFDDKTELFDCEVEFVLRLQRAGTLSNN